VRRQWQLSQALIDHYGRRAERDAA
jgi:hypothetical protein